MKKTKLLAKWKNLDKSDKIYYITICAFVLSAIVAMFIGLAIYGWNLIDLLRDGRTVLITFIATIILVVATWFLGQRAVMKGQTPTQRKILKIVVAVLIVAVIFSVVLIIVNWEVWLNGNK